MSRLARFLRTTWSAARDRSSPRECRADRPASFAEIVAASAFLDFGGLPSGDWLHAWEASAEHDRRLPAASVLPASKLGNKYIGQDPIEEKTIFDRVRSQHAECDFAGDSALPFRSENGAPMLPIYELKGRSHMRLEPVDVAMCVAAFGFIVGTLVFAHPTSPTSRTASAIKADTGVAATASKATGTTLSRLTGGR
jgi:hypothetical protein